MKHAASIVILFLFAALFSSAAAESPGGSYPDKSPLIKNTRGYASEDQWAVLFLGSGISVQSVQVKERQYYDQNNNYCYDPPRVDYYLAWSGGRRIRIKMNGLISNIVSPGSLLADLENGIISEKVMEPFGGDPKYTMAGKPEKIKVTRYKTVMRGTAVHRMAKTRKSFILTSELYSINKTPVISFTLVQRETLSSVSSLSIYRHTASAAGAMLFSAEAELRSTEPAHQTDAAVNEIAAALQGLLPLSPKENGSTAKALAGRWTGSTRRTYGSGENQNSYRTSDSIQFGTDGSFLWKGSIGADFRTAGIIARVGSGQLAGTYRVMGKRLVIKDKSGRTASFPFDHPEPRFLQIGGKYFVRDK